jgi:NTP pyrophosphatase (non-canonical NTP hydrolase)
MKKKRMPKEIAEYYRPYDEYQKWVASKWNGKTKKLTFRDLFIMTAGLGGESGEVLEILKKSERPKAPKIDKEHLTEELGDVFYYLNMLCNYYDLKFQDVVKSNICKLNKRYGKPNK